MRQKLLFFRATPFVLLIMFIFIGHESRDRILAPNSPTMSSRKRKELGVAKISLIIAMIFILCHFVKWIPNIHEMIMVMNTIIETLFVK